MNLPQLTITMNRGQLKATMSHRLPAIDRPRVTCSFEAAECLRPLFDGIMEYRERFVVLLMNRNNRVICHAIVSEGGTGGTVVDARVIFQHAIMANATHIVLCHNHPSGNLTPSSQDTVITQKIKEAAKLFDMIVSDHIIITEESYYSFADNHLI